MGIVSLSLFPCEGITAGADVAAAPKCGDVLLIPLFSLHANIIDFIISESRSFFKR
jgi:hypothetical protein